MELNRLEKDTLMLLTAILADVEIDKEYIICVMAKTDSYRNRRLASKGDLPMIYGYIRERIPVYLMKRKIMTNIPREGSELQLISGSDLPKVEMVINGGGNWDLTKKLEFIGGYLNKGASKDYPTAQPYLVYRSKVQEYIDEMESKQSMLEVTSSEVGVGALVLVEKKGASFIFGEGEIVQFEKTDQNQYKLFEYFIDQKKKISMGELSDKFGNEIGDIKKDLGRLRIRIESQCKGWLKLNGIAGDRKSKGSAVYWLSYSGNGHRSAE